MSPSQAPSFDHDTPHDLLAIDGGRIAHWSFGRGPAIVAIHGWPLHAATFRRILPRLASDYTVHLFDLPGAGRTEWHGPIGFESNAEALRTAIDALRLDDYAIVAHDSGGVVARFLAADDPRVRGLVLAGSEIPGHHSALLQAYVWAARAPFVPALLGRALQIPVVRRSPLAFGTCFTDARYVDGEFAALFVEPLRRPDVLRGQVALLRAFSFALVDRLAEVHRRITAPTLCIWGDRDPFFPVAKARAMLRQFGGGATLAAIPGGKLFPHEDHPLEFVQHALPFLADCLAASRPDSRSRAASGGAAPS